MLPADVRAAGELIQAGKLLIAVTKAGSLGLGGVLEPRVRLQGGSYGGFGFLECLTMRFLGGFGLCRCFPIRFWVAGVGLGSPGGAVLMSGRQKGAGRTGHRISRPNTEPPDPMGLFSPPKPDGIFIGPSAQPPYSSPSSPHSPRDTFLQPQWVRKQGTCSFRAEGAGGGKPQDFTPKPTPQPPQTRLLQPERAPGSK